MDKEKALAKIKKCLALADSANEHEAAAAMRQAKALMDKFKLNLQTVAKSDINRVEVDSKTNKRTPKWNYILVVAVAKYFECRAMIINNANGTRQWGFVGKNSNPEIAAYAYEVLFAQLLKCKKRYQDGLLPGMSKRQLGNYFCLGWVDAVSDVVRDFAKEPSIKDQLAIQEYIKEKSNGRARNPFGSSNINSQAQMDAFTQGQMQGEKAQLHHGVYGGLRQIACLS